ncbi:hypothetical protein CCMA1212_002061 [Trichoderma ghanense]|uniref:Uncharacterized protein n=1 Tax=Trichoderma ghanense TaxID=65468 RepID=A0ABY2HEG4_9HYPO
MRLRGGDSDTEGTMRFARTQASRCHLAHSQFATSAGTPSQSWDLAPAGMSFVLHAALPYIQYLRTCMSHAARRALNTAKHPGRRQNPRSREASVQAAPGKAWGALAG